MTLTGVLGGPYSQLGQVQPGYAIVQGRAQWLGPFMARTGAIFTQTGMTSLPSVQPGDTLNAGVTACTQLVAGDPSWWMAH